MHDRIRHEARQSGWPIQGVQQNDSAFAQYRPTRLFGRDIRYKVDRELSQITTDGILTDTIAPEHPPVTATGLECIICQIPYDNNSRVAILGCSHHYHHGCIGRWIDQQRAEPDPRCPICRYECIVIDVRLSSDLNGRDMTDYLTPSGYATSSEDQPPLAESDADGAATRRV